MRHSLNTYTRTDKHYDAIVTGGGIAGSAAAILLARAGARVAVIERTEVFRDRVRGEWLAPWGAAEVRRLGLESVFEAAGAHRLPWNVSRSGRPRYQSTPEGDVPLTFSHPRLQEELLAAAWDVGVTVIRPALVESVTPREGGNSPAVTIQQQGRRGVLRASLVIGADGRSSLARKTAALNEHLHRSSRLLAGVLLSGVGGSDDRSHFLIRPRGEGLAMIYPRGDGYARGYVFLPSASEADFRGPDGFDFFIRAALESGIPEEILANVEQEGPLAAFVADDSWVDHPYRDGLALVGDAAGVSDPTWGMGISLALRDARALTEAWISEGAVEPAGHRYAEERDAYYRVVRTAENWQSDLLFSPGEEADARRLRAAQHWSKDPGSFPDLNGLGPDLDVSEAAYRRFLGLDEIATEYAGELVTA